MKYLGLFLLGMLFLNACSPRTFNENKPYFELVYQAQNGAEIDEDLKSVVNQRIEMTGLKSFRYQSLIEDGALRLRFTDVEPTLIEEIKKSLAVSGKFNIYPSYDYAAISTDFKTVRDSMYRHNVKFGLDTRFLKDFEKQAAGLGPKKGILGHFRKLDQAPLNRMIEDKEIKNALPRDLNFYWGANALNTLDKKDPNWLEIYDLYIAKESGGIVNESMVRAAKIIVDSGNGHEVLSIEFNDKGRKNFSELSEENIDRPLLMVLDGEVISAPIVREKISGGKVSIVTGLRDKDYYENLRKVLLSGPLTSPIELVSENLVNP